MLDGGKTIMKKDTKILLISSIGLFIGGIIFLYLDYKIIGGGWLFTSGYGIRSFLHRLFAERDLSVSDKQSEGKKQ
jgi:hypothetical protein